MQANPNEPMTPTRLKNKTRVDPRAPIRAFVGPASFVGNHVAFLMEKPLGIETIRITRIWCSLVEADMSQRHHPNGRRSQQLGEAL
jgi:hypothetical protein